MNNKKVKQMMLDGYQSLYSKYTNNYHEEKNLWAFDRLRLFEGNWNRTLLRYDQYSKVSIKNKEG